MKTPTLPGLVLLVLCATPGLASTAIDRSLEAAPEGRVRISSVAGEVTISGSDEDRVQVTGRLDEQVRELVFERDGDTVLVRVEVERDARDIGDTRLDIRVPRHSTLDVDTVSADVVLTGVLGPLQVHTVSGDVELDTGAPVVNVSTMSGDLELRGTGQQGDLRLASVSGDVRVQGIDGNVETTSVSGDVRLTLGRVDRLRVKSTSGDVRASLTLAADARVELESVGGDTRVDLSGPTDGDYALNSFSGEIEVCFGPEAERQGFGPGRRLDFRQGKGGPSIRATTMSGSVVICD